MMKFCLNSFNSQAKPKIRYKLIEKSTTCFQSKEAKILSATSLKRLPKPSQLKIGYVGLKLG